MGHRHGKPVTLIGCKIAELYDALIKSEREKIALLEKLMEKMNEKK